MRASILILLAACATAGGGSTGTVTLKPSSNYAARPVMYSVGKQHVSGTALDVSIRDNCIRGTWGSVPVNFCREDKGGPVQQWKGATGEFTVAAEGNQVSVDGFWTLDTGRTVSMTQVIPVEQGGGWDELRQNPALLAVAVTAANLGAQHIAH